MITQKRQVCHKINFDLKGHIRSHKVIFVFEVKLFFDIFFLGSFIFLKVETKLFLDIFFS